jgi:DNA-binding NarL/FixJ family response regulator
VIRVAVVDDEALVRYGLRVLLAGEDDIAVVAEAPNGLAAIDIVRAARPDLVLMDVRMPDMDGIAALRLITAEPDLVGTRVIMLTTFELDEYVFESLQHGASGFLVKDTEPEDVIRAVRLVASGESLLSPTVTRRVIREFAARRPRVAAHRDHLARHTDRERQVVALVAEGLSSDEIAGRLLLSPATVRTHTSRAMTKLHARDRAQLVVFAYQSGLVPDQ